MIQRSASSGRYVFYPRVIAPCTGAEDLEWVEASGRGVVYSTTVIRSKPPAPSRNVALVQLEEGPRLMTRVESIDPGEVRIDMPVKARIVQQQDFAFVVFDPA
ncbi:MAG: hypothetical protein JWR16_3130 [Nevskia sp.]|nr:hypothetical protein [Nevskia sp.]